MQLSVCLDFFGLGSPHHYTHTHRGLLKSSQGRKQTSGRPYSEGRDPEEKERLEECRLGSAYPFVSDKEAVGMLVLTGDFVVGDQIHQVLDKVHHLLMPGHVGHGETAG